MGIVFIIGAGASNEIGMPIGIELRKCIIDILSAVKDCLDVSSANMSHYFDNKTLPCPVGLARFLLAYGSHSSKQKSCQKGLYN